MKLGSFYLQMHALVAELITDIGDEYRAQDSEPGDDTPAMTLTIGADARNWSYQTGDNSFTGGAYSYSRPWAVVTIYRDSAPPDVAEEIIDQLAEDDSEPPTFDPIPKRTKLDVSFEIVTPESAEQGDVAERGWIVIGANLRAALESLRQTRTSRVDGVTAIDMDSIPCVRPRWITVTNGMEFQTGAVESRTLHIPDSITAASARRIAKLAGAKLS